MTVFLIVETARFSNRQLNGILQPNYPTMKRLFCLFAAMALTLSALTSVQAQETPSQEGLKPVKYVFLFIGDGMSSPQRQMCDNYLTAIGQPGMLMNSFPVKSPTTTWSANKLVTDSAASGTAIACGEKTNNGRIGMDASGTRKLESSAYVAKKTGKKVGILTSVTLNHATPASFYGNQDDRGKYYLLGLDLLKSGFDFFGGGAIDKHNDKKYKKYVDDVYKNTLSAGKDFKGDIYELAEDFGYEVVHDADDILDLEPGDSKIIACQKEGSLPYAINHEKGLRLDQYLAKAIEMLDGTNGFFIMCEGGKIDWVGHANDAGSVLNESIALDKAVKVAYDFYEKHPDETLIIVTGDHETGGLTLGFAGEGIQANYKLLQHQTCSRDRFRDEIYRIEHKKDLTFDEVKPLIEKSFGFKFDGPKDDPMTVTEEELNLLLKGFEKDKKDYHNRALAPVVFKIFDKKVGLSWTTGSHTALPVITSAVGVNADFFKGNLDNTDISKKLKAIFQAK